VKAAYDAQFIALALETGILCVTEGQELQEKFPGIAISIEGFLERAPADGVHESKKSYRARTERRYQSL